MPTPPISRPDSEYWKLGLAAVLAGQSMALSLGLNVAQLGPEHPLYYILHGVLIVAALSVLILLGKPLFVNTFRALEKKHLSMESLFLLSLVGAWVSSCLSTFYTHGPIYYEVLIIVCLIYTLGKMIRNYSKDKAHTEAKRLKVELSTVYIMEGNQRVQRSIQAIEVGQKVSIIPGDLITVDGIIVCGRGFVQESALTGEAGPVLKQVGDCILAGTYSVDASFSVQASALDGKRLIDSILDTVEAAKWVPSLLEKKAEAIVQHFVPLVLCVWLFSFVYWTLASDWVEAMFNSMCVLLVACPCAFGLATPIAVYAGLYGLAGKGLVSKKAYILDILAKADTLVLDKTGTLTEEDLSIKHWTHLPEELLRAPTSDASLSSDPDTLARIVALVQQQYPHPLAKAFTKAYRPSQKHSVLETSQIPGEGISAKVYCHENAETLNVLIGSLKLMPQDAKTLKVLESLTLSEPHTRKVYIAVNGSLLACVDLEETLRKDTLDSLKALQALGLRLSILSGDPSPAHKSIGGIEVSYGLKPAEKMHAIQRLKDAKATILYVGDGLNDVPAMNLCQASIALDHGSPLAQYSADGIILGERLSTLVEAIRLARKVYTTVLSNYTIAIVYNVCGIGFAASGLLNPVGAAAIMLLSSITVALRAYAASQPQSILARERLPQTP